MDGVEKSAGDKADVKLQECAECYEVRMYMKKANQIIKELYKLLEKFNEKQKSDQDGFCHKCDRVFTILTNEISLLERESSIFSDVISELKTERKRLGMHQKSLLPFDSIDSLKSVRKTVGTPTQEVLQRTPSAKPIWGPPTAGVMALNSLPVPFARTTRGGQEKPCNIEIQLLRDMVEQRNNMNSRFSKIVELQEAENKQKDKAMANLKQMLEEKSKKRAVEINSLKEDIQNLQKCLKKEKNRSKILMKTKDDSYRDAEICKAISLKEKILKLKDKNSRAIKVLQQKDLGALSEEELIKMRRLDVLAEEIKNVELELLSRMEILGIDADLGIDSTVLKQKLNKLDRAEYEDNITEIRQQDAPMQERQIEDDENNTHTHSSDK